MLSCTHFYSSLGLFEDTNTLRPKVIVSDSGSNPNRAECDLIINLFSIEDTVTTNVAVTLGEFDANTLKQLLSAILNLEVDITGSTRLNESFYEVDLIGYNNGEVVLAENLAFLLNSLTDDQRSQLLSAGLDITRVQSNAPVTTPTQPPSVPTRPIPTWAVVVIVVLNSVIIIGFLLIVLGVTWRRFRR